jgi:hypothetical protein
MSRTIIAAYNNIYAANEAAYDLIAYGFPENRVTITADSARGQVQYINQFDDTGYIQSDVLPGAAELGITIGMGIGAAAGLVCGILTSFIPILEGGSADIAAIPNALLICFLGLVAGAFLGGLIGRMLANFIGLGVPAEEAERYLEKLREKDILVTIQTEPYNLNLVLDVLHRYRPQDIHEQVVFQQGWRFEPIYVNESKRS